jgi:hypothetical protein
VIFLIQLSIICALVLVAELAFARGKAQRPDESASSQMSAMQGAMLGLLGLLLGFTASMAEGRFSDRRALILAESNAIGTTLLRAEIFASPERELVRGALKKYTDARLAFYSDATVNPQPLQAEIWQHATGLIQRNEKAGIFFAAAVNEMIDLEGARLAALDTHVPVSLLVLLVLVAIVAVGTTAYAWAPKRSLLGVSILPVLVGIAISVVIDLDSPRTGLIRAGQAPLERLRQSMEP